jgi:hypothetical protein
LKFTGRSQVVAPGGLLLQRAPAQRDLLYIVEIDPTLARNKAITARNDLIADRRPQFYVEPAVSSDRSARINERRPS